MMIPTNPRQPAVAGQFYPSSEKKLKELIQSFIPGPRDKVNALACMLPHAGYIYSGRVATETLSRIHIKNKIILLGPNHTGYGERFSIITEGSWQLPFGQLKINPELAKRILKNSTLLKCDPLAHAYEHSIEVELPILQYFNKNIEFVPISISSDDLLDLKKIAEEIALSLQEDREGLPLIVASSDMTHYEPQAIAARKDKEAINAILELDEEKLMRRIRELDISMCGYAPVATMLVAAKKLGAKKGELIKYQTSGDITNDFESVVGYAGIIIS